jgi:hypothetical protein
MGSPLDWADRGRLVGTFNLPSGRGMNGLAAYVGLFLPVTVALALDRRGGVARRAAWVVGSAVLVGALVLTATRTTPVALLAAALLAAAVARPRWLLPLGVVAVGAVLLWPNLVVRSVGVGTDRPALAWAALHLGAEAPWLGHGDVHYNTFLLARPDIMHTPFGVAATTPHNSLALAWFRYGLLGPVVVGVLLLLPPGWFARRLGAVDAAARPYAVAGLVGFAAFALQSLTNNLLEVPKVAVFFWALWAVLSEVVHEAREGGR